MGRTSVSSQCTCERFAAGVRFDVFARALTKGCYHYENSTDRFTSIAAMVGADALKTPMGVLRTPRGSIQAGSYHGDTMVQCLVNHLSLFSVGLFNPEIETDFSFQYVTEHREVSFSRETEPFLLAIHFCIFQQNITASMIVIVMTVHMLFIMIFVVNFETIEADKVFANTSYVAFPVHFCIGASGIW